MRMRLIAILVALAGTAAAQPTAAPTPAAVGSVRGDNAGGYNVTTSFEAGYRFRSVGGNLGRYRSDVNFGNGLRLLSGALTVHSREGHGRLFDEIALSTLGLGNDPYQFSNLRVQKNGLYRYDMIWRLNEYYNPLLPLAPDQHAADTVRRLQDHDFVLFPQSSFRLFAGYTRNSQDGPALSTVQPFASPDPILTLLEEVRRLRNEYRLGWEMRVKGVRLNILRGWDRFAENTAATGTSFRRTEPYRGSSPYWRATLATESKLWAANGRFSYTDGMRRFYFEEMASGTGRFGAALSRQILVAGEGRRPVAAGNLNLTLFPNSRVSLTNHTAFHSTRMEGDSVYREVLNANALDNLLQFRYLGIRAISNLTDVSLRAGRKVALYGGYHFTQRRIRSREQLSVGNFSEVVAAGQDSRLHAGLAGVRVQPVQPLRISLDAEVGRADRPFYPISERRYHALGGRIQYRTRNLQLTAATRANYRFNSVALSVHSSRARNYSFDGSWNAREWLSLDGGYSRLHLDTLSGLAFFASGALQTFPYAYLSEIHATHGGVRLALTSRAEVWLGYSRVQDKRDFPLTFESPLARFSLRLGPKLRWNAAYQHYRSTETRFNPAGYRAHTGYTSLLWSF